MPRGTPTYLSVSPTGQVTALFTGGLQLYEYQGAVIVYNEFDQITFLNPSNNPQEIIYGQLAGGGGLTHTLNLLSGTAPDPGPGGSYAQLQLANTPGVSGQSGIYVSTSDSVNNTSYLATILDSLGRSSFMRLAPTAKTAGYTAVNGDYVLMTNGGTARTVTLPTPTAGQFIGVESIDGSGTLPTTVATPSGAIVGPGVVAATASILLGAARAFVILESDGTNWHIISGAQDTGWLAVGNGSMTNAWVNGSPAFGYRLQGNVVRLRGVLTTGGSGINALTLPAGYRPATAINVPASVIGFANAAAIITTGGVLQPAYASAGGGWSADGITFTVD